MLTRRSILAAALAGGAWLSFPAWRQALAAAPITIFDPIGPGSSMNQALSLIVPSFGAALGTTAQVKSLAGYPAATNALLVGPADGSVLMGRNSLGTAMEMAFDPSSRVNELAPIGKITAGMSAALVVTKESPLASFEDFTAAARKAPLGFVHFVSEVPLLARAMLRRDLGVDFADVEVAQMGDVGILLTNALLLPMAAPLRPLCTFGGERHAAFPQTPTFRELTGPKDSAFTAAFGLYGSGAIPQPEQDRLSGALITAGGEVADEAAAQGIKLDIGGQDLLLETMKRDARIATALKPWL